MGSLDYAETAGLQANSLDGAGAQHRSKLSSAHVYLRQPDDQPHGAWDSLPPALVNDAAQLVKANSIEGELAAADCSRACMGMS